MPYIKRENRESLRDGTRAASNAGDLNYQITLLLDDYLTRRGLNYGNLNELVGVLECAKMELYRRIAVPYEDKKIKENSDVYTVA